MATRIIRMFAEFQLRARRVWLGVGVVAACAGQADVSVRPIADNMRPWESTVLRHGPRHPTHLAVRDSATWTAFWSPPVGSGDQPAPPVDFRRETVLVFAEGESSASTDPPPIFRGAYLVGDTLIVRVRREEYCGPGTEDIVYAMALGRVSRYDGPVVFDFEVVPCRDSENAVYQRFRAG